mmetsp:Transcript_24775/g.21980  ORF Transcript_24775/g.21980 Transcript_24775/m.21980 type:complete len:88 (+) Transcript_24775:247-510(+)
MKEFTIKSIQRKINEIKYSIQEEILTKSFSFSLLGILILCVLAYFLLNLFGEYLPVLGLSVLVSVALRPTKDQIAMNLKWLLGIEKK